MPDHIEFNLVVLRVRTFKLITKRICLSGTQENLASLATSVSEKWILKFLKEGLLIIREQTSGHITHHVRASS